MAKRQQRGNARDKAICLPIAAGVNYGELVEDREPIVSLSTINLPNILSYFQPESRRAIAFTV